MARRVFMVLIFAVATAALRMQAFALGALERPPLPRMAATMLEQGPERPAAAALSVPPPRRLTDLLELEARGAPRKEGSLFTGRTRRVVRRGMHACASNPGPQNPRPQSQRQVSLLRAVDPHQRACPPTRRSARLRLAHGRLEGKDPRLRQHLRAVPREVAQHPRAVRAQARQHGQSPPLAVPQLGSCASSLGSQPLPRLLPATAAANAAHFFAFDHPGAPSTR